MPSVIFSNNMKVFVYTLGCRLNQCESEAIAEAFEKHGHEVLKESRGADLIIVNTCTVTSKAEQKARRMIRLFCAQCPTLVTGCYAQMNGDEIAALSSNAVVLPLSRKPELLRLPEFFNDRIGLEVLEVLTDFVQETPQAGCTNFDFAPIGFTYHCRSYLKVQDGCDNNCGFCRVHVARGRSSSLEAEVAVQRALEIEKRGYHEIVLTGVNLSMYDHKGAGLGGLLEKLLQALGPDIRIRFSSLEPDHIDDRLLEQLGDSRVQPHFHIPIQSAADKVIKRINRHYDSNHLDYVVNKLREIKDDPFLACDIITGLPAEGDEEFNFTKEFLERHGFAMLHVFPFSPRPNTPLEKARDRAPESVRDERAKILRDLALELNGKYLARQVGKPAEVILEEKKKGAWFGLTGNYMKVKVNDVKDGARCGDLVPVVITSPDSAVVRL